MIEMYDDHYPALAEIRRLSSIDDSQRLDVLNCLLCQTPENTPAGNILLDATIALRMEIEHEAKLTAEDAQEIYMRSRGYRENLRNEAISRGA